MDKFLLYLEQEKEKREPFKGEQVFPLIERMLPFIGDKDAHIRDDLIYVCLAIVSEHLKHDERTKLLDSYLSEDYLFYDIENTEDYSVVKRTFTLLQLAVLLYYHHQEKVMDEVFVEKIVNALIEYLGLETVLKGYDEQVGWMHSIAHSADVLGQLLSVKGLAIETQTALLDAFLQKIQVHHYTYIDNEDERIVTAIEKGLKSGALSRDVLFDFVRKTPIYPRQDSAKDLYVIQNNVKHLLQSLFFRLEDDTDLVIEIRQAMKKNKDHKKS